MIAGESTAVPPSVPSRRRLPSNLGRWVLGSALVAVLIAASLSIDLYAVRHLNLDEWSWYILSALAVAGCCVACAGLTLIKLAIRDGKSIAGFFFTLLVAIAVAQSIGFELTFYGINYGDSTAIRQQKKNVAADIDKDIAALETKLEGRTTKRTSDEIKAEIKALLARKVEGSTQSLARATSNCTQAKTWAFALCAPVNRLNVELAAAQGYEAAEKELKDARRNRRSAEQVSDAHPAAAVISRFLGYIWALEDSDAARKARERMVLDFLVLISVAFVQLGKLLIGHVCLPVGIKRRAASDLKGAAGVPPLKQASNDNAHGEADLVAVQVARVTASPVRSTASPHEGNTNSEAQVGRVTPSPELQVGSVTASPVRSTPSPVRSTASPEDGDSVVSDNAHALKDNNFVPSPTRVTASPVRSTPSPDQDDASSELQVERVTPSPELQVGSVTASPVRSTPSPVRSTASPEDGDTISEARVTQVTPSPVRSTLSPEADDDLGPNVVRLVRPNAVTVNSIEEFAARCFDYHPNYVERADNILRAYSLLTSELPHESPFFKSFLAAVQPYGAMKARRNRYYRQYEGLRLKPAIFRIAPHSSEWRFFGAQSA